METIWHAHESCRFGLIEKLDRIIKALYDEDFGAVAGAFRLVLNLIRSL